MVVQSQSLDAYDDRRLVAAFQAGDVDAFTQIVGAHHGSLTAEARRRLRSYGDAEDAVQETLLRAYLALDRFGGEYRLHAWLSRILANVCADAGARRSAELRLVDRMGSPRDEAPPADEGVGDAEEHRAAREAIAALPDSYRMAFVLREIEDFSYAEVAQKMGISETNARARVHRARRSLTLALRSAGAALAGFAIPSNLFGLKRLVPRSAGKRVPGLASYSNNSRVVPTGPDIPSVAIPATSQSSLPTLFQAPLAETSQAVTLAAASPLSQTLIAGASVAWHATLPVAAALATVAASAAMAGSGAAASGPISPVPTDSSHVIMAAGTTDLATFLATPATTGQPGAPADPSANPGSPTPSSSAGSAAPSASSTVAAVTAPISSLWGWVDSAASSVTGDLPTTSPTVSVSSGSQPPTQAAGASASAGATPPVACPWTGSFPGAPAGPIPLPPPEPAGAVASSYFSSDTFTLGTTGPAFEVGGLGQFAQGANTMTLQTLYGACLPATTNPELVANLSNPADLALGEMQLRGALVSSQTTGGDTTAYYRGTSVWLDGPNASTAPLDFVAQVTLGEPEGISTLRVAFFGPAPAFAPPAACPTTAGTTPGTSPTDASNCTPPATTNTTSDPATTTTTSDPASTPTTATSTSPSPSPAPSTSDPQGSTDGTSSTDASSPATTSTTDPAPSSMGFNSTGWNSPIVTSSAAS
jgi:RNA polymerase sigma-70 factor (ECF subfamily)